MGGAGDGKHKKKYGHPNRGGVGMYIHDNIDYTVRHDLSVFGPHIIETLFIEIREKKKTIQISSRGL